MKKQSKLKDKDLPDGQFQYRWKKLDLSDGGCTLVDVVAGGAGSNDMVANTKIGALDLLHEWGLYKQAADEDWILVKETLTPVLRISHEVIETIDAIVSDD